jgi:hypothetical protein
LRADGHGVIVGLANNTPWAGVTSLLAQGGLRQWCAIENRSLAQLVWSSINVASISGSSQWGTWSCSFSMSTRSFPPCVAKKHADRCIAAICAVNHERLHFFIADPIVQLFELGVAKAELSLQLRQALAQNVVVFSVPSIEHSS